MRQQESLRPPITISVFTVHLLSRRLFRHITRIFRWDGPYASVMQAPAMACSRFGCRVDCSVVNKA